MEKETFIVSCINEDKEIVEVKPFDSFMDAFEYMSSCYRRESKCFEHGDIFTKAAHATNEDDTIGYWWSIDKITINF